MLRRLLRCLRPQPVQPMRVDGETVIATWGLSLMAVTEALDAHAEGAAELAAEILQRRRARRPAANPTETLP